MSVNSVKVTKVLKKDMIDVLDLFEKDENALQLEFSVKLNDYQIFDSSDDIERGRQVLVEKNSLEYDHFADRECKDMSFRMLAYYHSKFIEDDESDDYRLDREHGLIGFSFGYLTSAHVVVVLILILIYLQSTGF